MGFPNGLQPHRAAVLSRPGKTLKIKETTWETSEKTTNKDSETETKGDPLIRSKTSRDCHSEHVHEIGIAVLYSCPKTKVDIASLR